MGKRLSDYELSRLNSRFEKKPSQAADKPENPKNSVLAQLMRNIQSQRLLAEWLEILRSEQEILLGKLRDPNKMKDYNRL